MKKLLLIAIAIILLTSLINAEIVFKIDKDGKIIASDETKYESLIASNPNMQNNINIIGEILKSNPDQTIKIDETTKVIKVEDSKGIVMQIPNGLKIEKQGEGYKFSGNIEKIEKIHSVTESHFAGFNGMAYTTLNYKYNVNPYIIFNNFLIQASDSVDISVSKDKNGNSKIDVNSNVDQISSLTEELRNSVGLGKIDFANKLDYKLKSTILSKEGFKQVLNGKNFLKSLDKGVVKLNKNNQITFADISSSNGGEYKINYEEKQFVFKLSSGGHFVFDPEKKIIEGEKAIVHLPTKDQMGSTLESKEKFKIEVDEKGELVKINLAKGSVFNYNYNYKLSSDNDFTIYFNKDEKDISPNSIIINKDKTILSGKIKIIDTALSYEGLGDNSLTEITQNTKFEDNFDVKKGDAIIRNKRHEVTIKDGDVKIKKFESIGARSFGFTYTDKNGNNINGLMDEDLDKYDIKIKGSNGKEIVLSIPFSQLSNDFVNSDRINFEIKNQNLGEILQKDLDNIDKKINEIYRGERTKEIDQLDLERVVKRNLLNRLEKKDIDSNIQELKDYLENVKDPELKAKAELMLAESLGKKASSIVPSGTIKIIEKGILIDDVRLTFKEEIINGKRVITEVAKGDSQDFKKLNEEIPGLGSLDADIIREVIASNSIDKALKSHTVLSYGEGEGNYLTLETKVESVLEESSEYKQIKELQEESKKLYESINKYADENNDKTLQAVSSLGLAGVDRSSGDLLDSIDKFEKLAESSSDKGVKSEAQRLSALIRFQENPRENAVKVLDELRSSIESDKDNENAAESLKEVQLKLLEDRARLNRDEPDKVLGDIYKILGKGSGNAWVDQASNIFHPVTAWYYQLSGRAEDILNQQQQKLNENDLRILGNQGLRQIISNGYDSLEFLRSDLMTKFQTMSRINNLDEIVKFEDVKRYVEEENINLGSNYDKYKNSFDTSSSTPNDNVYVQAQKFQQDYQGEVKRLFERIEKEKGSVIANEYFNKFNTEMLKIGAVEKAVENNRDLYEIATNGRKVEGLEYNGNMEADKAFTSTRTGTEIERTWTEALALPVGDFAVTLVALGGIGKYVAVGAEAAGITRGFNVLRTALNPGEAIALRAIGEESIATTITGIGLDVGAQMTASSVISAFNPAAGGVFDIVSSVITMKAGGLKGELQGALRTLEGELVPALSFSTKQELESFAKAKGLEQIEEGLFKGKGESGRALLYVGEEIPATSLSESGTLIGRDELKQEIAARVEAVSSNLESTERQLAEAANTGAASEARGITGVGVDGIEGNLAKRVGTEVEVLTRDFGSMVLTPEQQLLRDQIRAAEKYEADLIEHVAKTEPSVSSIDEFYTNHPEIKSIRDSLSSSNELDELVQKVFVERGYKFRLEQGYSEKNMGLGIGVASHGESKVIIIDAGVDADQLLKTLSHEQVHGLRLQEFCFGECPIGYMQKDVFFDTKRGIFRGNLDFDPDSLDRTMAVRFISEQGLDELNARVTSEWLTARLKGESEVSMQKVSEWFDDFREKYGGRGISTGRSQFEAAGKSFTPNFEELTKMVDDFSVKNMDFSTGLTRSIVDNTVESSFLISTREFAFNSKVKIEGYSAPELAEYLAKDADDLSYDLIASDFGGRKVEAERILDPKYGELYKVLPLDNELKSKGLFYYFQRDMKGVYTPVGVGDGVSATFSIPEPPSIRFRTPAELKKVKFDETVYVRFEWISEAEWPGAGEVGNLPYLQDKLSTKRGPRISTFTQDQLTRDGFFDMTRKQQDAYLKEFGIDQYVRNRRMIYYQLEQGITTEIYRGPSSSYTNIIVDGKVVPAVKVLNVK